MGELSFVDKKTPINKLAPPPKYFTDDFIRKEFALPTQIQDILKGIEYTKYGGLVCTSEEMLEKQRGVLANVVK